ncbi:SDR family NAD(P)-dependent oxidoreductase [Novosphingobium sp. TH158]|uniref:SDR family NAD(P)-dependent oxidoreductase n=1 Tax=Novosphingobium sp. TH158 TaxID=2067455 RepID=UPI000C7B95A4|nr:SDR family NAD(P)-dependent oxidoreductase [Novosphingobium sp. TH158]PLK26932.1 short-chain dehydrogenase [Novosphingobium sp. TH158]
MKQLEGKVAVVTGAGQGVGRGIARALAAAGARVVLAGRTLEKCEKVLAEIEAEGGSGLALACNVAEREECEALIGRTVAVFGRLDVLVNNAHTSRPMVGVEDTRDKDLALAFQGFHGGFHCMRAAFPHLKAAKGRVINLGSVAGIRGDAGFGAYAAAKEAVRGLSRVAAREWGVHGITVNVICPFSESPGVEYMIDTQPGFIDELTEQTSMKRLGNSREDVGATVVFLCGPGGSYITGQTINVDGGIWIAP